jgi:hypothetical protein
MSFSQVDMAALLQDGTRLAICGDLTGEEGKMLESAEIFFVVHQDGSVVRGRGTYRAGENEWGACAHLTQPSLRPGQAVAMGLVVLERVNPVGFTTLTWMQDITILDRLPSGRINPCVGERGATR